MCRIFKGYIYKGDLLGDDDGYLELSIFPTRDELLQTLEPEDDPSLIVAARVMVELEAEEQCCP